MKQWNENHNRYNQVKPRSITDNNVITITNSMNDEIDYIGDTSSNTCITSCSGGCSVTCTGGAESTICGGCQFACSALCGGFNCSGECTRGCGNDCKGTCNSASMVKNTPNVRGGTSSNGLCNTCDAVCAAGCTSDCGGTCADNCGDTCHGKCMNTCVGGASSSKVLLEGPSMVSSSELIASGLLNMEDIAKIDGGATHGGGAERNKIKDVVVHNSMHIFDTPQGAKLKFTTETKDVKELIMANGIYNRYDMDWGNRFSRFGIIDPYNSKTTTREYLFFTKPDLCIFNTTGGSIKEELANISPFFRDAVARFKTSAGQLQSSCDVCKGPFMPMLSNAVTSSLDVPGLSAEMIESAANVKGTKISYRGSSYKSDEDHDFSLEFEDTKNLDVYMLFKMWDEYEKLKWAGLLDFAHWSGCDRWTNYTINKVLHDQITVYKIVVAEDGYRIIFMARVTGVVPNSIPRDAFSDMNDNGVQKLSVGFKGHWVRDMDPVIISNFNAIATNNGKNKGVDSPLFNIGTHSMNGEWPAGPYIYAESNSRGIVDYYLRWYNYS